MRNFYTLFLTGLLFCMAGNLSGQMFTVGLTSTEGNVGEEVCIDLVGENFVDLVGLQFTMIFDTSALEFVSATGSINGTAVSIVNPPFFPTEIRLSYSPFSSAGYTEPGPITFGTICFTIRQDITTNVVIDPDPDLFEFSVNDGGGFQFFGPANAVISNGTIMGGTGMGSTCTDGIQNGNETGVDCGGSCAPCMTMPTCSDGIQNGNETGVDCGGSCAPCMMTPTCSDGVQNGNETGVDCGGSCTPCMATTTCGEGSTLFNLCGSEVCDIAVGGQACIELNVANFTNITAVQVDLLYPGNNLEFVSATGHPDIGTSLTSNELSDGQVRLLFFRSADSPVTLADGESFATVCFTNESATATAINLDRARITSTTNNNLQAELSSASVNGCGNNMPTCTDGIQNGNETGVDCGGSCQPCMTGGGGDDCGAGSDRFNLCVSDACDVAVGDQVCVDLTVSMFTNITGFQAKIFYPGANLDYVNFTNVHPALGDGVQVNDVSDGEVRVFFFRAANSPATVPDGESIVTICFTNQTTSATTLDAAQIVVTDTDGDVIGPIANDGSVNGNGCSTTGETCSDGVMNNGETGVDCGGPNCAACPVTTTCGVGTTDVDFCVGTVCGNAGAEVCLPVFIGNFNSLGGLQFSLAFTAANLDYTRFIPSPNLQGISVSAPNDSDGNRIDGIVNFVWADLSGNGVSFPADEPVVELCFTVENSNVTPLTFRDPAARVRATDILGGRLPVRLNPGAVNQNCGNMETCSDGIQNNGETGVDCGGPNCAACPVDTCTDGIQNNGETGVDCGGPCGPCSTGSISLNAGSGMAQIGQQVCIDVTVADFADIANVGLTLGYNSASLSLVSVTANPALPGFGPASFTTTTSGQIVVNYAPNAPQTISDGEVLFEVCFDVIGPDESPLTITNATATTGGGTTLMIAANNGVINPGGVNEYDELTLVANNVNGAVGTEVCVDIRVFNLDNLAGLQFGIDFDETKLEYTRSVSTDELPGLLVANSNGFLRVIWFDPNAGSNSVDDGLSIVEVCFNVLEACNTPIDITDQPPGFRNRATDPEGELVDLGTVDGNVNSRISCGPTGTPPNLILDLESASGPVGTEVCVDLNVTNFTTLTQLDFSIAHDPAKVRFSRAINFGLASLTSANVGSSGNNSVQFNWNAPGSTGQSLPAGARLVTLCYFVESLEIAPLNFSNSPTMIMARNADNQNVGVVPSGGVINPDAPTVDGLTFQIGSATAQVGEEICLPIIGFQAIDLVGFQYTINYDPAILEYQGTGPDFAFDGLNNGSISLTQPGVLSVLWPSPSAVPQTLAEGRALYSICFRVLSDDPTFVTFGDSPTDIEFEEEDGIIEAMLLNGQVNGSGALAIADADIRSPSCAGDGNGSIALTVSGGTDLVYNWSPNVSAGAAATGLSAGSYSVTITNTVTSQSIMQTFVVNESTLFNIEAAQIEGISCNGSRDGRILIATVGPDTGPYTFDWGGSLPDGVPEQINLDAGLYDVTVTNANGCVRSLDNILVGEPNVLTVAGSPNDISPGGTGGVTIQVNGGSRPYRYAWTGPDGYFSDVEDINDVTEPGTYCLTVLDNNSCTTTQCYAIINALAVISTDVNVGCVGEESCSINIEVVGGNGEYDYEWTFDGTVVSNDQDLILTDCQFGDYTLRITSGTNVITQVIELESPTEIVIDAVIRPSTNGDNGSIVLTPTGGSPPYNFDWGGGVTDQNRENLTPGEYCVTVTDSNECTGENCFVVGASAASILEVLTTAPVCSDGEDGTIMIALNNGVAPVNVRIVPLNIDTNFTSTTVDVNVPAGSWRVFLTDALGSQVDTLVTVSGPVAVSAAATVTSDTEDTGCSGMISLDITGGTGPYMVTWTGGLTGPAISSLCAGAYVPTITDANGCTLIAEAITVGRIDEDMVAITDVACADGTEGGIDVSITGGMAPYTFAWQREGSMDVIAMTEDISGQTAGDYTLMVTDATGATLTINYTIGISAGFDVGVDITTDFDGFGVSCADATDGRIVITLSGQGEFMYEFLLGDVMVGMDSVLENAAAGVYTVSVIDDGGCAVTRTVEVTAPPEIMLSSLVADVSCNLTGDGSVAVTPSGGTPNYSFLWSTGAVTSRIVSLSAGDYGLTVTDDNDCTAEEIYTLTAPEDLLITFEATEATEGCNGSIQVLPLGGSGSYRYNWPQLPNQGNNPFAEGLCPGEYTVEVTDENGCQMRTMVATVLDRSLPCLDVRRVITPDGDGLNERFVIFCSDGDAAINNNLQVFNRWGQLVYRANDYDCTDLGGINCFEGETNDGVILPEGPYYYVFEFTSLGGEQMQQRGSLSILRD